MNWGLDKRRKGVDTMNWGLDKRRKGVDKMIDIRVR